MTIYINDQGQIFGEHPEWKFPHPDHTKDNLYFSCLKRAKYYAILFEDHWNVIVRLPSIATDIKTGLRPGIYTVDLPEVEIITQTKDLLTGLWVNGSGPETRQLYRFVERKEEVYEGMKYFEVYCLNFSKVIHSDSLFSAVLEFVKEHPFERVILAEDTVLFRLAKELTPSESQEFIPCGQGENHCNCKSKEECGYIESQEELWRELIDLYDKADASSYGYGYLINRLKDKFTITRKP